MYMRALVRIFNLQQPTATQYTLCTDLQLPMRIRYEAHRGM